MLNQDLRTLLEAFADEKEVIVVNPITKEIMEINTVTDFTLPGDVAAVQIEIKNTVSYGNYYSK